MKGGKGTRLWEPHREGQGWEHGRSLKQLGLGYAGVGFLLSPACGDALEGPERPPPLPYHDASFFFFFHFLRFYLFI